MSLASTMTKTDNTENKGRRSLCSEASEMQPLPAVLGLWNESKKGSLLMNAQNREIITADQIFTLESRWNNQRSQV